MELYKLRKVLFTIFPQVHYENTGLQEKNFCIMEGTKIFWENARYFELLLSRNLKYRATMLAFYIGFLIVPFYISC